MPAPTATLTRVAVASAAVALTSIAASVCAAARGRHRRRPLPPTADRCRCNAPHALAALLGGARACTSCLRTLAGRQLCCNNAGTGPGALQAATALQATIAGILMLAAMPQLQRCPPGTGREQAVQTGVLVRHWRECRAWEESLGRCKSKKAVAGPREPKCTWGRARPGAGAVLPQLPHLPPVAHRSRALTGSGPGTRVCLASVRLNWGQE